MNNILQYEEAQQYVATRSKEMQYLLVNAIFCFFKTVDGHFDEFEGDFSLLAYVKSVETIFSNKVFIQDVWNGEGSKYEWWSDDE